jgi:hypothetical protein
MTSERFCSAICTAIWLYRRGGAHRLGVPSYGQRLLIFGAYRGRGDAVAAESFDLVEGGRVLGAGQRRRRRHAELLRRAQHEGLDLGPMRTHRQRDAAHRVLPPLPGQRAREVVGTHARLGMLRAVVGAQRQDGRGRLSAELDAGRFDVGWHSAQSRQVFGQQVGEGGGLRREQRGQRVVRGLGHGSVDRRRPARARQVGVALVAAGDRVDGIEDGDVHDRHRARRAPRAELLAEDARLAGRNRRVVDAAAVDRNLVPAPHGRCRARPMTPRVTRRAVAAALRVE